MVLLNDENVELPCIATCSVIGIMFCTVADTPTILNASPAVVSLYHWYDIMKSSII